LDRLHPTRNPGAQDLSLLNAVGVLAPVNAEATQVLAVGSGFLIDACHVLTALHVPSAYRGDYDAPPPPGQPVEFLVGQVDTGELNETEGLREVRFGSVSGSGQTGSHHGTSDKPAADWALVTLNASIESIPAHLPVSVNPLDLSAQSWIVADSQEVGCAGFAHDHARENSPRLHADLWGAFGHVLEVQVDPATGAAFMHLDTPATPGASGGMVFARVGGELAPVGILQSRIGDGVHDLAHFPTRAVLFTPSLVAEIDRLRAEHPCPGAVPGPAAVP
jgi:hypothetical protein